MKLSIIILNYKSYSLLKNCIRSLLKNEPKCEYEVILVDAESDRVELNKIKNLKELEKKNNFVFLPLEKNIGYAQGNNKGIAKAQGEYVAILNPDVVVFPNTFDNLVEYLDKDSQTAVIGPKILNPDRSIQASCFRFPSFFYPLYRRTKLGKTKFGQRWLGWFLMADFDKNSIRNVDWLLGAFIVVRKKAIDEVGFLDGRYFLFLEDTDWCLRFWQSGWKIKYFPNSVVVHYPNRASRQKGIFHHVFKKIAWIHLISWLKYYFKNVFFNKKYRSLN